MTAYRTRSGPPSIVRVAPGMCGRRRFRAIARASVWNFPRPMGAARRVSSTAAPPTRRLRARWVVAVVARRGRRVSLPARAQRPQARVRPQCGRVVSGKKRQTRSEQPALTGAGSSRRSGCSDDHRAADIARNFTQRVNDLANTMSESSHARARRGALIAVEHAATGVSYAPRATVFYDSHWHRRRTYRTSARVRHLHRRVTHFEPILSHSHRKSTASDRRRR